MADIQSILASFKSGRISRRELGTALMATGIGATMVASLYDKALAEEPKKGGTLRVASTESSTSDTMDPAKIIQNIDILRSGVVYDTLVEYVPGQGLLPALAESWEGNGDATEWRLALRKGVVFHNGKEMTAADVVSSFNRHLDPQYSSPANAFLGDVDSFAADGDALVVRMKQPNADIPYLLAEYHFTVQPEGQTDFGAGTVGTGAWQIQEFEPGVTGNFVRNPNYWRSNLPYIDAIESFGIPDVNSRVNALLAGDVDMIVSLDPQAAGALSSNDAVQVLNQPGGAHNTYPMFATTPPFTDNNLRLAIKHAVDRERLLELAFNGLGVVGRDHPIPQHDPFFAEDVAPLPRDPDKVKHYLKQAGMENTALELHTTDGAFGGTRAAEVMVELMREAGLNVSVIKDPADGYFSAVWMQVPWFTSWWYGRPTADLMFSIAYITGGAWNESAWSNERFDKLVVEARKTTDTAKRKELYRECQMIQRDEGSSLIPVFTNWLDAYGARVRNFHGHPSLFLGAMKWQEVWLADA